MNKAHVIQFFVDHGPIQDDEKTGSRAVQRSWEIAQQLAENGHDQYRSSLPGWRYHLKALEDDGLLVMSRKGPRHTWLIAASEMAKEKYPPTVTEEVPPVAAPESVEPSTEDVEAVETRTARRASKLAEPSSADPMVSIQVTLPAAQAARILDGLTEDSPTPISGDAPRLASSQMEVLVTGYRQMTSKLENFVAETFAAWVEMTEKIDRIEDLLSRVPGLEQDPEEDPPALAPVPELTEDGSSDQPRLKKAVKKGTALKPKLAEVPGNIDKDLRSLYGLAAHYYTITSTGAGHVKLTPKDSNNGRQVIHGPSTPSDHRSVKNLKALLRREGVELP